MGTGRGRGGKAFKTAPRALIDSLPLMETLGSVVGLLGGRRREGQAPHSVLGLQGPGPPACQPETWVQVLKRMLTLTSSSNPTSLTQGAGHPNPLLPPHAPPPLAPQVALVSTAWWGWGKGRLEPLGVVRNQLGVESWKQGPGPRAQDLEDRSHGLMARGFMALLPHALLRFPHPGKVLAHSSPCCRPSDLQTGTPRGEQPSPCPHPLQKTQNGGSWGGGPNVRPPPSRINLKAPDPWGPQSPWEGPGAGNQERGTQTSGFPGTEQMGVSPEPPLVWGPPLTSPVPAHGAGVGWGGGRSLNRVGRRGAGPQGSRKGSPGQVEATVPGSQ